MVLDGCAAGVTVTCAHAAVIIAMPSGGVQVLIVADDVVMRHCVCGRPARLVHGVRARLPGTKRFEYGLNEKEIVDSLARGARSS